MTRDSKPLGILFETALAKRHGTPVAGVDEAGRGPWAGPVVAAAVILEPGAISLGLQDSKKLGEARRERLFAELQRVASIGVGQAGVAEIDRLNILEATYLAMRRAIAALPCRPAAVLVDGNRAPPGLAMPAETLVGGDGLAASVAAASIVAKVTRDRIMRALAARHPGYGWERNKGYGTAEHQAALKRLGVTPEHRRSFRPIHNMLCEEKDIKL